MALKDTIDTLNKAQDFLNQNNPLDSDKRNQFKNDGFMLPSTFSADGNGLPYTKVPSFNSGQIKRNIITWFIPEFGIVRMYVNPQSISYNHKKAISREKTKGGFTLQYWGEDLSTLNINGNTGSSGIEGINMLYEIYRAEQYAFDGVGLLGGILGMNSPQNTLSAQNIPSLAQLAFGVEMYYGGCVYRGYFDSMTITESATDFLWGYQITFVVTQMRGYRTNYFPFHRTPAQGPSQYGTPSSFNLDDIKDIIF